MTRIEAAAEGFHGAMTDPVSFASDWAGEIKAALAAADAHDAAHGIHRVSLDDATVERSARAIFPSYWDGDAAECFETPEALTECQKGCTGHVRAVLAAAVEANHV